MASWSVDIDPYAASSGFVIQVMGFQTVAYERELRFYISYHNGNSSVTKNFKFIISGGVEPNGNYTFSGLVPDREFTFTLRGVYGITEGHTLPEKLWPTDERPDPDPVQTFSTSGSRVEINTYTISPSDGICYCTLTPNTLQWTWTIMGDMIRRPLYEGSWYFYKGWGEEWVNNDNASRSNFANVDRNVTQAAMTFNESTSPQDFWLYGRYYERSLTDTNQTFIDYYGPVVCLGHISIRKYYDQIVIDNGSVAPNEILKQQTPEDLGPPVLFTWSYSGNLDFSGLDRTDGIWTFYRTTRAFLNPLTLSGAIEMGQVAQEDIDSGSSINVTYEIEHFTYNRPITFYIWMRYHGNVRAYDGGLYLLGTIKIVNQLTQSVFIYCRPNGGTTGALAWRACVPYIYTNNSWHKVSPDIYTGHWHL